MENKVTEINIVPIKPKDGLVAFASIVFDNCLYLGSIGIFTKLDGGYRLAYPNKKMGDRSVNVYFPINKETASYIEKRVISKYEEVMNNSYAGYSRSDTQK